MQSRLLPFSKPIDALGPIAPNSVKIPAKYCNGTQQDLAASCGGGANINSISSSSGSSSSRGIDGVAGGLGRGVDIGNRNSAQGVNNIYASMPPAPPSKGSEFAQVSASKPTTQPTSSSWEVQEMQEAQVGARGDTNTSVEKLNAISTQPLTVSMDSVTVQDKQ